MSVLDSYFLELYKKDKKLAEILRFFAQQLEQIQQTEAQSLGTLLVTGGVEDLTVYQGDRPVTDRSLFTHLVLGANQTEYQMGAKYFNRMESSANIRIDGVLPAPNGQAHVVVNVGTNRIVFGHDNASSANVRNRILCVGLADILLQQGDMMFIWRDGVTDRWRAAQL